MKRSGSRHRSSGNQPTTNTANDGGSVGHCGMGGGESRDDCEHERRDAVRSTYLVSSKCPSDQPAIRHNYQAFLCAANEVIAFLYIIPIEFLKIFDRDACFLP